VYWWRWYVGLWITFRVRVFAFFLLEITEDLLGGKVVFLEDHMWSDVM
jgi:hypothetical protein